jgi:hypothetical protein
MAEEHKDEPRVEYRGYTINGLTLAALKAIMDERDTRYEQVAAEKEKAIGAALAAAEKAVEVAQRNAEKWRDSANEWRAAMTDKDRNFVTKNALWGYFVAILSLAVAAAMIIVQTMHQR